jgi:hypothetical protein
MWRCTSRPYPIQRANRFSILSAQARFFALTAVYLSDVPPDCNQWRREKRSG